MPFGSDLADEFRSYLRCRGAATLSSDAPLLLSFRGRRYCTGTISWALRRLLRQTGLKPEHGRRGPRPNDIRHTFAVHRLTRWYRQGVELQGRLPWLSVYMGHANILGTETYLTMTPELLGLVSRRFETRFQRPALSQKTPELAAIGQGVVSADFRRRQVSGPAGPGEDRRGKPPAR